MIKAVDEYQDLLRVSVASAGNDHRLGANEAPPAIVSMFLGDELTEILEALELDKPYRGREKHQMEIGATVLPHFPKDSTDRNRTSPFAFTGNKFEFRMLGSAFSIAGPNIVLNTIVAEELSGFADALEKSSDFKKDLARLIKTTIAEHKRIIFNGNNYAQEWVAEAEKRGLSNLKSTVDAMPAFIQPKNAQLFAKHHVFSDTELHSRYEILLDNYSKTIHIEALTTLDLARQQILPASLTYQKELVTLLKAKRDCALDTSLEEKLTGKLSALCTSLSDEITKLEEAVAKAESISDTLAQAACFHDAVFAGMESLRAVADELEMTVSKAYWPLPDYGEILYSVN